MWNTPDSHDDVVPLNHRTRFIEATQELKFDQMNTLINKEIVDFQLGKA